MGLADTWATQAESHEQSYQKIDNADEWIIRVDLYLKQKDIKIVYDYSKIMKLLLASED